MFMKLAQESNQTTVNNIMGGSDSITATGKRKISTTIDVDDSTPSSYSGNQNSSKRRNLSDITNICPTVSNLQSNLQTPFTSGGCVSKISTNGIIKNIQICAYSFVCFFNCLTGRLTSVSFVR